MQNKKQHIITMAILIIVATGGAFYGGTVYEKKSLATQGLLRNLNAVVNRQGASDGQGQRGPGRTRGDMGPNGGGRGGDFTTGQITAKDDKSITIKSQDGNSKIVFFSDATTVRKTTPGSAVDLNVGAQVMVNGKSGADGSLSAQNIQVRQIQ